MPTTDEQITEMEWDTGITLIDIKSPVISNHVMCNTFIPGAEVFISQNMGLHTQSGA